MYLYLDSVPEFGLCVPPDGPSRALLGPKSRPGAPRMPSEALKHCKTRCFSRSRRRPRVLFVVPGLWPFTGGYFLGGRRIDVLVIYVLLGGRRINSVVIYLLLRVRRINFVVFYQVSRSRRHLQSVSAHRLGPETRAGYLIKRGCVERRDIVSDGSSGAPLGPETRAG